MDLLVEEGVTSFKRHGYPDVCYSDDGQIPAPLQRPPRTAG
ncbi:hypothetical protein SGRIM128S_08482 [Streptomyces griseomycini]